MKQITNSHTTPGLYNILVLCSLSIFLPLFLICDATASINYVFDWAVNNDIVPYSVSRQVNLKDLNFRDADNYEEIYSDEERKKLLKVVLNHPEAVIARMFVILFCMPLRLGEVRSIKWSDVDFENHTKGKKKKCNRYIPLSKTTEDLFRREYELRTNAIEDSFVFSFTNGLNPVSESPVYRLPHLKRKSR